MTQDTFANVMASLQRCLGQRDFLYRFYDLLIEARPEVAQLFRTTRFDDHFATLGHALTASVAFAGGVQIGESVLYRIARTHGRYGMDIESDLYPAWVDSLVQAVQEHDPNFNAELGDRWRQALERAVRRIQAYTETASPEALQGAPPLTARRSA